MNDGYIICEYKGDLVRVQFDNEMSGWYPKYDSAKVIKKNCQPLNDYGLLCERDWEFSYKLVKDSWDGFQPVDDIDLDKVDAIDIVIDILLQFRHGIMDGYGCKKNKL